MPRRKDAEQGRRTRRTPKEVAALVILVAMAMVLSFVEFPLFPSAEFLEFDFSEVVALLSAFLFGPWIGAAVAVLAWVPRLVTDPLGSFMNIAASLAVVIVSGVFYRREHTWKGAAKGVVIGSAASVVISILLNYIAIPIYSGYTVADVSAIVLPVLLPFNVLKLVINCTIALIVFRRLEKLLMGNDPRPSRR